MASVRDCPHATAMEEEDNWCYGVIIGWRGGFLGKHKLPKLTQEEMDRLNSPVFTLETAFGGTKFLLLLFCDSGV
jgi:hypothetical protein